MRYQGKNLFNRVNLATAAIATVLAVMPLAGCGGGGAAGSSPAGVTTSGGQVPESSTASTNVDFKVVGDESLRARAASKGILFGAATKEALLSDTQFANAFANECNILVPEWELKWTALRPNASSYNFSYADSVLNFAQNNGIQFRGHTLVWHSALPEWFQSTVTAENAEQILRSHITTVVGRYAGKVHSWDVVNEAINPSENAADGMRASSPWYKLIGPDYVEIAFRAAAEADPNAMLVYNDYGLDYDTPDADARRDAVLKLLTKLKASGTPIHALGIQAHLNGNETRFNAEKFSNFLSQVAKLGLKIMITEMDVRDQLLTGATETRDQVVAAAYSEYLTAALKEPAVIAILTWGLSDRYTWISKVAPRGDSEPVRPLPLDGDMNRKPAWRAIANAIDNTFAR